MVLLVTNNRNLSNKCKRKMCFNVKKQLFCLATLFENRENC